MNIQADDQCQEGTAAEDIVVAAVTTQGSAALKKRSKESFNIDVPFQAEPMHVHRLMSLLNKCARQGSLSKDRLTRVAMSVTLAEQFK